jgi:hypothetical protein
MATNEHTQPNQPEFVDEHGNYPIRYSIIKEDGELRFHFDLGDFSYDGKRRIFFPHTSVVAIGEINDPNHYQGFLEDLANGKIPENARLVY